MHLVAIAAIFSPALVAQAPIRNTLVVVFDDLGVDNVGCYGVSATAAPTPNLDALAARGVRFNDATACPTCSPTRASLMTGRHGFRTGIGAALPPVAPGLDPAETLLPEILRPAGIRTGLVGKWHLGNDQGPATPTVEGFDVFVGNFQGALPSYYQWPKTEDGAVAISDRYATTDCVDEALEFIANAGSTPWFLVLSLNAPHWPYQAPPAALHSQDLTGRNPLTDPIPFSKAMVEAADREFGRLLATLSPTTLARTNVVALGDNGTAQAVVEPPLTVTTAKASLYQGGVRVPLIVAGPSVGGQPRVENRMVHVVDLFPTLAALQNVNAFAAVPPGTTLDGVSFRQLLTTPIAPPPRAYVYTQQFVGTTAMAVPGDGELMRNARYTLLRTVQPSLRVAEEFYDLVADPLQQVDLLQQPLSAAAFLAYTNIRRELAELRDYPWTAEFGLPCSGADVTPTLAPLPNSEPAIGATLSLRIAGLLGETGVAVGAIGFATDSWQGVPLPLDLTSIGMTGCRLWIAPAWTTAQSGPIASSFLSIAVPDDQTLVGQRFYVQAFPLVEGANPLQFLATNAVLAVVGR